MNKQQQTHSFETWEHIAAAYKNQFERKKLRESIKPLVRDIATNYADSSNEKEKELVEVGLTHFDQAITAYYQRTKRRRKAGESTYAFSTYFTWWVRKDIQKHLGIEKEIASWTKWLLRVRKLVRDWKTSLLLYIRE